MLQIKVSQDLDIKLLKEQREILKVSSTDNFNAYELYLEGLEYFNKGYLETTAQVACLFSND